MALARFFVRVARRRSPAYVLVACGLLVWGCSHETDRLEQAYAAAAIQKVAVAPVDGTVTIDGAAPEPFTFVFLWDPKNPTASMPRAMCESDGKFAFTSYQPGDGVPFGSYVVAFARFNMGGRLGNFDPPDLLNNLYNDPEKNASRPEFLITVAAPGRTDYQFDLSVAGNAPVPKPGAHSVTELKFGT